MPEGEQGPTMLGLTDQGLHHDSTFVNRAHDSFSKLGLSLPWQSATPLMGLIPPQVDLTANILLNLQDNPSINMPHQIIQNCFDDFSWDTLLDISKFILMAQSLKMGPFQLDFCSFNPAGYWLVAPARAHSSRCRAVCYTQGHATCH
jgi:hypothetical protein